MISSYLSKLWWAEESISWSRHKLSQDTTVVNRSVKNWTDRITKTDKIVLIHCYWVINFLMVLWKKNYWIIGLISIFQYWAIDISLLQFKIFSLGFVESSPNSLIPTWVFNSSHLHSSHFKKSKRVFLLVNPTTNCQIFT